MSEFSEEPSFENGSSPRNETADVIDKSEVLIKITRHTTEEFSSRQVKEKGMFIGVGSLIHHH